MFLGVVYKIVQFNPYVKIPMIPLEYQLLEGEYNSMIRIMTILKHVFNNKNDWITRRKRILG